jgi:hypothetical protein
MTKANDFVDDITKPTTKLKDDNTSKKIILTD